MLASGTPAARNAVIRLQLDRCRWRGALHREPGHGCGGADRRQQEGGVPSSQGTQDGGCAVVGLGQLLQQSAALVVSGSAAPCAKTSAPDTTPRTEPRTPGTVCRPPDPIWPGSAFCPGRTAIHSGEPRTVHTIMVGTSAPLAAAAPSGDRRVAGRTAPTAPARCPSVQRWPVTAATAAPG
jgi:hypothetical protein